MQYRFSWQKYLTADAIPLLLAEVLDQTGAERARHHHDQTQGRIFAHVGADAAGGHRDAANAVDQGVLGHAQAPGSPSARLRAKSMAAWTRRRIRSPSSGRLASFNTCPAQPRPGSASQ